MGQTWIILDLHIHMQTHGDTDGLGLGKRKGIGGVSNDIQSLP